MRYVFLLLTLLCGSVNGQQPVPSPKEAVSPPQVDVAEVLRRGDMVVVAGEGPRGADEDAMRMATAPPPDESHMWFVTVIKTTNCQYCTKLISDFQTAPELLALVAAAAPYKAWGHFNQYNVTDETQKWRVKAYQVSGYPTIVIQPPRNGMWGNPKTVVFQTTGYDGNPKKLATAIMTGVRKYAAVMSKQGYPKIQSLEGGSQETRSANRDLGQMFGVQTPLWGKVEAGPKSSEVPVRYSAVVGGSRQATPEPTAPVPVEVYTVEGGRGQAPFVTPPRVDPFNPQPISPNQPSLFPPTFPPPDPTPVAPTVPTTPTPPSTTPGLIVDLILKSLGSLFGSPTITNLSLLIMLGIQAMSMIAPMTKTKLDDEALAFLKSIAHSNQSMAVNEGVSSPLPTNLPDPTIPKS